MPSPGARGAGLRALAGAGLWVLTGCGVIIDEPQYDTRAEQRPGTWVRRPETETGKPRGAYDDMIVARVRPLLQAHESELPRPLLEGWETLSGWVRFLGKP